VQSRRQSLLEALAGTVLGFAISMSASAIIYPLFGFHSTFAQTFWITAIFTVISILRSYALRRLFNLLHAR